MQTGIDEPKYGYAIYEEVAGKGKIKKLVIGYQYDDAYPFVEPVGLARVKIGEKYGFISTTGVMMISPRFEKADDFNEKGFSRVVLDGKYGLIDNKGSFVIPNKYDNMEDLLNGWYEVSQGDVW